MRYLQGASVAFQKLTPAQRERAKARKADAKARFVERVKVDAERAAFLFVACADGQLNDTEVELLAERFGTELTFVSPSREALSRNLRAYVKICSPTLGEKQRLRRELTRCATCDGRSTAEEESALAFILEILGLSAEKRAANRKGWGRRAGRDTESGADTREARKARAKRVVPQKPAATHWSYEYLGCSESDSDETIKRCYRQLAVKLHPDKHAAKVKKPEDALPHIRAFQKLQAAYDEVWKLRGAPQSKR